MWVDTHPIFEIGIGTFDEPNNAVTVLKNGNVGIGTNNPQGKLDVNGPIYQRGNQIHADYVFESDYPLETIEEHAEFMWKNRHLKAIPKARVDEDGKEIVEVGSHRKGIVEELENVRKQGYAIDNEEYYEGARCVAAPVRAGGRIQAAVSVTGSIFTMTMDRINRELVGLVTETAKTISNEMVW